MKMCHIIAIPMTGVGLHGGFRGNSWYEHRINIFKNYTLKSLANQTNKDFLLWMWFRPEEEHNPLTSRLREAVEKAGVPHVFTFNGLMYWDDKFNNFRWKTRVRNALMMLLDMWHYREWKSLREIVRNSWENKNLTLPMRVDRSLKDLGETIGMDYDWVYLTRIDSDDLFHEEAANLIQSQEPAERKALVFGSGYILNVNTGQLAEWNPPTNPPFHTIIFPGNVFFRPLQHIAYYGDFKTHEDIHDVFNCTTLDMNKYIVSFHGKHISTAWTSPALKKAYHKVKYGKVDPFKGPEIKGYLYTTSGKNISTHWQSRTGHIRNPMIGREFGGEVKEEILHGFGLN